MTEQQYWCTQHSHVITDADIKRILTFRGNEENYQIALGRDGLSHPLYSPERSARAIADAEARRQHPQEEKVTFVYKPVDTFVDTSAAEPSYVVPDDETYQEQE